MKSITDSKRLVSQAWRLTKPYWRSLEKWQAYKLLTLTLLCSVLGIRASVALNAFYKDFYDALQTFNVSALRIALLHFSIILIVIIFSYGYAVYTTGVLGARWRRWLTQYYLQRLPPLANLTVIDNADQRISQDLDLFTDNSLKILLILVEASLALISFAWILWQQNAYLVAIAIAYGIIGTAITTWIGKQLTRLDYESQRVNADFRFALMKSREKKTNSAATHLHALFAPIYGNTLAIVSLKKRLTYFTSGFNTIAYVIGILCALPLYFSRQLQLGGLMQMSGAFSSVVGAFYRIVNGFSLFAEWVAVIQRLDELDQAVIIDTAQPSPPLTIENPLEPAKS